MAIPVILKGETSKPIPLALKEGYDYSGCCLHVGFCGLCRTFCDLVPGGTVELDFSADETVRFPLGTSKVTLSLENANGDIRFMPWAKIKVTDSPADLYDAQITIDPASLDVDDLTAGDSLGVVKSRLNAVMAFLRGLKVLAVCALPFFALADVAPLYTTPNDMPGDAPLMTNTEAFVESMMEAAGKVKSVNGKTGDVELTAYDADGFTEWHPYPNEEVAGYEIVSCVWTNGAWQVKVREFATGDIWSGTDPSPKDALMLTVFSEMNSLVRERKPVQEILESVLTNKVDKSGVQIGSTFIGFTDEGVCVRDMTTGKGMLLSDNMMVRKASAGDTYYYAYPNGSGTFALASDIPNVPAWALESHKPTYTASEVGATSPEAVSNIVSTTYVHKKLGVWMEYDEATGFYYYCHEEE